MYKNYERKMEQGQLFPAGQSKNAKDTLSTKSVTREPPRCMRCPEIYEPSQECNTNVLVGPSNTANCSPTSNWLCYEHNPPTSNLSVIETPCEMKHNVKISIAQFENDMAQVKQRLLNVSLDKSLSHNCVGAGALHECEVETEAGPISMEITNSKQPDLIQHNKPEESMIGPQMPNTQHMQMRGYWYGLERETESDRPCFPLTGKVPYNTLVRPVEDRCELLDGETGCAKPLNLDIERILVTAKNPERPVDCKPTSEALQFQIYYLNEKPMKQLKKIRKETLNVIETDND